MKKESLFNMNDTELEEKIHKNMSPFEIMVQREAHQSSEGWI